MTLDEENVLRVWDLESGLPLTPPLQHPDKIDNCQFHPDGTRIVTNSVRGVARIWKLPDYSSISADQVGQLCELLSISDQSESPHSPRDLSNIWNQLKRQQPHLFQSSRTFDDWCNAQILESQSSSDRDAANYFYLLKLTMELEADE